LKTIEYKSVYFLSGEPKNGKTTIAGKFNLRVIALDELFLQYYNNLTGTDHRGKFSIWHTWPKLSDSEKNDFGAIIENELHKFIISSDTEIVFDGWLLKFFKESIKVKFADALLICDISVMKYCCHVDNVVFINDNEADIEKNIVIPVKQYFRGKTLKSLNINYHYFEKIGIGNPIQKSAQKYAAFNLSDIIKNKIVLDIGCNSGYNCFNMSLTASGVTGLDILPVALKNAAVIKHFLYNSGKINFIQGNILDFNQDTYDVILASSIIHYFVAAQQQFIDKCLELLTDQGILVLELGIAEHSFITKRADNILCEYPSEHALLNVLCKNFNLIYKSPSVNQAGDSVPRFIYHLQKK
jgi:2-polyprenyl-3-methyl-5-hydroxy-6-metoxy-1,4-benzoquinol methylase